MSTKEWTNKDALILVKAYEKREELWNKHHNMFRVQSIKKQAWTAIAQMFDCDVIHVKRKFNSILASYRRERAKVKEGWKSHWYLYKHLKFQRGYVESPTKNLRPEADKAIERYEDYESIEPEYSSEENDASEDDEQETEIVIKKEPVAQAFAHKKITPINKKKNNVTAKRRMLRPVKSKDEMYTKMYVDSRILEMQRMMKNESKKDDCDMFGEYIASIIRKHDNKTQCVIKQAINNILFEQEMNTYDNPLEMEADNMDEEILDEPQ